MPDLCHGFLDKALWGACLNGQGDSLTVLSFSYRTFSSIRQCELIQGPLKVVSSTEFCMEICKNDYTFWLSKTPPPQKWHPLEIFKILVLTPLLRNEGIPCMSATQRPYRSKVKRPQARQLPSTNEAFFWDLAPCQVRTNGLLLPVRSWGNAYKAHRFSPGKYQ